MHRYPTRLSLLVCLLMLSIVGSRSTLAQPSGSPINGTGVTGPPTSRSADTPPPSPDATTAPATLTGEQIQAQLQAVESDTQLTEADKKQALDLLKQAQAEWELVQALKAQTQAFQKQAEGVQQQLDQLEQQLAVKEQPLELPDGQRLSIEQLEAKVAEKQMALETAIAEVDRLAAEQKRRADRRLAIPKRVSEINGLIDQTRKELAALPPGELSGPVGKAQQILLQTRLARLAEELDTLKQELAAYDQTDPLLPRQLELAQRLRKRLEQELKAWQSAVTEKRQEIVAQQRAQAESQAAEVPAELKALAEANLVLVERRAELSRKMKEANDRAAELRELVRNWSDEFERAEEQVRLQAGVTESLGALLRTQRTELPNLKRLQAEAWQRREEIDQLRSEQFTLADRLRQLADLDEATDRIIEPLANSVGYEYAESLRDDARKLLQSQRDNLEALTQEVRKYLEQLVNLNVQLDTLIRLVKQYRDFIDANVLWIRSIPPASLKDVDAYRQAFAWVSQPQRWIRLGTALVNDLQQRYWLHGLVALVLLVWLRYRWKAVARLKRLGELASAPMCQNFVVTAESLLWTLVLAWTWPALLQYLAWTLETTRNADRLSLAAPLAEGLRAAAWVYLPLSLWMYVVRVDGLAESHFKWSERVIKRIRRQLRLLTTMLVPTVAIFKTFEATGNLPLQQSVARGAFIVASISLAYSFGRLFKPSKGVFSDYLARHPDSWANRLRHGWFGLIVAIPLMLAALALAGYLYTAERLWLAFYYSLLYLSAVDLLEALAMRWLHINRLRIALAQARQRREAARQNADQATATESMSPDQQPAAISGGITEHDQIDLGAINEQTRRLVASFTVVLAIVGLYFIWVDVLPAMGRLNDIPLWRTTVTVQDVLEPAQQTQDAPQQVRTVETVRWVTAADLLVAMLAVVLTFVAIRNVPGLLEIAILQHLPLDAALRYAITTVTRYGIIITGLAIAMTKIGFGWSKVQWLLAAVSVGLGFGLQEIFANFVSGLILLFERPLRAGDIVTVGDTTGKVVRIKTRATVIQDWDRKELIVPNKEFVTGRLLNWTLTDQVNRLVIQVGIAYGSDVAKARQLLLQILTEHPKILEDPAPSVTFDMFGDSALNITIRAYLACMDDRLSTINELYETIHERFQQVGIEIPFPQRDVHLRTLPLPLTDKWGAPPPQE